MNDQLIRDLLHEVADDVEPGDRLDAIRAATAPTRRTPRGWWAAGGVGLLAASVVTALVLVTAVGPRGDRPGPAAPTGPAGGEDPACCETLPVYLVGDTPAGPRLFRELQRAARPAATSALRAAIRGEALDPDYRSAWPPGVEVGSYAVARDVITVSLTGEVRARPVGTSRSEASLAVEQLVRTAQGVAGRGPVPVRLLVDEQPSATVLGLDTVLPLDARPDLDVLAHVTLSDPFEGQVVQSDDHVTFAGRATSVDGWISLRLARVGGTAVIDAGRYTLYGTGDHPDVASVRESLAPFTLSFGSDRLRPGQYDAIASVQNADGTIDRDTRRITVVD